MILETTLRGTIYNLTPEANAALQPVSDGCPFCSGCDSASRGQPHSDARAYPDLSGQYRGQAQQSGKPLEGLSQGQAQA